MAPFISLPMLSLVALLAILQLILLVALSMALSLASLAMSLAKVLHHPPETQSLIEVLYQLLNTLIITPQNRQILF